MPLRRNVLHGEIPATVGNLSRQSLLNVSGKGAKNATAKEAEKPDAGKRSDGRRDGGGKLVHFDGPLSFTADDMLCATAEILGKITYGTVYKATMEHGSYVAVKRLREKIAKNHKEFEAEVNALGKLRTVDHG